MREDRAQNIYYTDSLQDIKPNAKQHRAFKVNEHWRSVWATAT